MSAGALLGRTARASIAVWGTIKMFRAITGWLATFAAVSLAHAASGPQPITQYETPAEARWAPFSSDLPKCEDTGVISTISDRFDRAETEFWGGKNAVLSFER